MIHLLPQQRMSLYQRAVELYNLNPGFSDVPLDDLATHNDCDLIAYVINMEPTNANEGETTDMDEHDLIEGRCDRLERDYGIKIKKPLRSWFRDVLLH